MRIFTTTHWIAELRSALVERGLTIQGVGLQVLIIVSAT